MGKKSFASIVCLVLAAGIHTAFAATDLSGYWISGSGAVYQFIQKGNDVIATFEKPNQAQSDGGVKPGDVAFTGKVTGSIVAGLFHQRFPTSLREKCPANWYSTTDLKLTISADGAEMDGVVLLPHISDTCEIDDGRMVQQVLKRTAKP